MTNGYRDDAVEERPAHPWMYGIAFTTLGAVYSFGAVYTAVVLLELGWLPYWIGALVVAGISVSMAKFKLRAVAGLLAGMLLGFVAIILPFLFLGY